MSPSLLFLTSGLLLLGPAALTGFMQARQTPGSVEHTLWRVAHSGGTAGGVQLFGAIVATPAYCALPLLLL